MSELLLRRRAMMQRKAEEPNGLLPTAACGIGNTVAYVLDDGLLYISYMQAYAPARPYFKKPLILSNGDTVEITMTNSGTSSGQYFSDIYLGGTKIFNNTFVDFRQGRTTTKNYSVTADMIADSFRWCWRTNGNKSCDIILEIHVFVNGIQAF